MSLDFLHQTGRKSVKYYITKDRYSDNGRQIDLPINLGYSKKFEGVIGDTWGELAWHRGKYVVRYYNKKFGMVYEEEVNRDTAFLLARLRLKEDKKLDPSYVPKIELDKMMREVRDIAAKAKSNRSKKK